MIDLCRFQSRSRGLFFLFVIRKKNSLFNEICLVIETSFPFVSSSDLSKQPVIAGSLDRIHIEREREKSRGSLEEILPSFPQAWLCLLKVNFKRNQTVCTTCCWFNYKRNERHRRNFVESSIKTDANFRFWVARKSSIAREGASMGNFSEFYCTRSSNKQLCNHINGMTGKQTSSKWKGITSSFVRYTESVNVKCF